MKVVLILAIGFLWGYVICDTNWLRGPEKKYEHGVNPVWYSDRFEVYDSLMFGSKDYRLGVYDLKNKKWIEAPY